jgi:hypothetical protein
MGTGGYFRWAKLPVLEADNPPLSSVEVKNARSYTTTPQYVFMVWHLVKHRDNLTFTVPVYVFISHYCHILAKVSP